jgi:hypothetical protein
MPEMQEHVSGVSMDGVNGRKQEYVSGASMDAPRDLERQIA